MYNELYERKITTTQFVCSTVFGNASFFFHYERRYCMGLIS